jgi:FlaA1/EpsC-like NDP-sugar epimerase
MTALKRLSNAILDLSRNTKRLIVLFADIALCAMSVWFAFYLRLGEWVPISDADWRPLFAFFLSVVLAIPIFLSAGLYRTIFRYSGLPVLMTLIRAAGIYGLAYAIVFTIIGFQGVPRTIGLIQPLLLLLAVGGSRVFASFLLGGAYRARLELTHASRTLIYGAGATGRQLANALANNPQLRVYGFLDDDPQLIGNSLNGKFIYPAQDLPSLISKFGITDVLLALPSTNRSRRNEIIGFIRSCKVHVRTLPSVADLAKGKVTVSDIHELDIEDLLGRDAVPPNDSLMRKHISNKVVLVTGAGGSIGSELCRQILRLNPSAIVLLEQGEFNLYRIHQELAQLLEIREQHAIHLIPVLASVRDEAVVRKAVKHHRPQTIYHAAAYKHVPLVEENPFEGIWNNVFGTLVIASIAAECAVESFTLISTDKAVRPTNVMGASKRLAEMVLQAMAQAQIGAAIQGYSEKQLPTLFSMVRFGNVLDSSGSVVPKFKEQIALGGPITLTHPDVTRYFMTIPEAAQLVIQASAMAKGGEVFLLDMGEPIKILDLATRMIELSGLTVCNSANPKGDIEIAITGLRPGEKLYEELLIADNPLKTDNPRIMMAREDYLPLPALREKLNALFSACEAQNAEAMKALLEELVAGYMPTHGKNAVMSSE